VLAKVASIFDPLGLISPSVIIYKTCLQKLWQNSLQWDVQLSPQLQGEWDKLCNTMPKLSEICINRKVVCIHATNLQLQCFCDSSERAYGACIYIRSTDSNQTVFCNLLCSSSRVAPLKKQTIPRLELCAAVLLTKLYKKGNCSSEHSHLIHLHVERLNNRPVMDSIIFQQMENVCSKSDSLHSGRDIISYLATRAIIRQPCRPHFS
jgi:hypothetical protein